MRRLLAHTPRRARRTLAAIIFVSLLMAIPAIAQITAINGTTQTTGCTLAGIANTGTCSPTLAPTAGNMVVCFDRSQQSPVTPYAFDSNLLTMQQGAAVPSSSGYQLTSFAQFAGAGVTGYTVVGMATNNSVACEQYSNVLGINLLPTVTACPGGGTIQPDGHSCIFTSTLTNPQITVTLNEANDVASCGITQNLGNAGASFTGAAPGNLRQTTASPTMVLVDNTSATTSVTVGATVASATNFRVACVVLRPVGITNTAGVIRQITTTGYVTSTGPANCQVNSVNCKGQIATPLPGSLLLVDFSDHSDFNDVQRSVNSFFFCPVNTGCGAGNGYGWSGGVSTGLIYPGGHCTAYVQDAQPESNGQDTFYRTSAIGTEQWFDAVRSGANATNERQIYTVIEVVPPSTPINQVAAFDGCPVPLQQSTLATSFTMPTASFAGSNEVLIYSFTGGAPPMVFSPQLQGASIPNHLAYGISVGQSSGVGGTLTGAGASNGGVAVVRAFEWVTATQTAFPLWWGR